MKADIAEVVRALEEAALAMQAALYKANRLWDRGGMTPTERHALNEAHALAKRAAVR